MLHSNPSRTRPAGLRTPWRWAVAALCLLVLPDCTKQPDTGPAATPAAESTPAPAHIPLPENWVNFLTRVNVKTLAFEKEQLWMGTPSGVIRYDTRTPDTNEVYTSDSTHGGLMSRGIYVIRVDAEGNKWIGTYGGGLAKYDGKTWTNYTVEDGLGDQWIYDIVWDKDGKMWIATWKGVSVFDGKKFRNYGVKDGLADKWVYSIALDPDGIFWFGTENGVSRFDPRATGRAAWTTYTHKNGLGADFPNPVQGNGLPAEAPVSALPTSEEDDGSGSYGSYDTGGQSHHMDPTKNNVGQNPDFVIAATVDRDNRKWFGTWGAGLSSFDGKTWTTYTDKDGLGGNFIHALETDSDGRVWAGTNGGVSWFDGNRWHTISKRDGLLDNNVFSIAFDNHGRRWFGTWQGLSMYQGPILARTGP